LSNVDLSSDCCSPFKTLALTISLIVDKYADKVTVCKVDVDRVNAIAEQYRVTAIPTVLIIRNGKKVNRLVRLQSETGYVTLLDKLVDKDKD
jgi:thioredoxin 1